METTGCYRTENWSRTWSRVRAPRRLQAEHSVELIFRSGQHNNTRNKQFRMSSVLIGINLLHLHAMVSVYRTLAKHRHGLLFVYTSTRCLFLVSNENVRYQE